MKKTKAATKKRQDGVRGSVKKAGRIITPKEREREREGEKKKRETEQTKTTAAKKTTKKKEGKGEMASG